ncbi:MAG: prepilin-type N-terminal cleavage/methylation domain-containing protein [Planctomycetes bacterium]|nr:prepilin-type N-terminal cleavage/methylation domain-containing protein [Planctomycetota bacterium]
MRPFGRAGFTMIELIVVIGIIVMVFGFVYPAFHSFLKLRRMDSAGRAVLGVLNEARSEAVSKRKKLYVVFLQDELKIYSAAAKGYLPEERRYSKKGIVKYRLRFAGEKYANSADIPDRLAEDSGKTPGGAINAPHPDNIYLAFTPTGTVEFGEFKDIGTGEYLSGKDADIIFDQREVEDIKGYIDIGAAGRVAFRIGETDAIQAQ